MKSKVDISHYPKVSFELRHINHVTGSRVICDMTLVNGRTSYSFWISEPYRNVRRTVHLEIWNRSVRRTRVRPYWRSPYGGRVRRTSDVNFSETVCLIYIKISQILNIDVDQKLLKFHVNQTTRFRDIDVGSWPFVFAVRRCRTLLPYIVAVLCSARYGTVRPNFDPT